MKRIEINNNVGLILGLDPKKVYNSSTINFYTIEPSKIVMGDCLLEA